MTEPKRKRNSVDILKMRSNVDGEDSPGNSSNPGDQTYGAEAQGRKILINSPLVGIVNILTFFNENIFRVKNTRRTKF
jgi:hypothetical protein